MQAVETEAQHLISEGRVFNLADGTQVRVLEYYKPYHHDRLVPLSPDDKRQEAEDAKIQVMDGEHKGQIGITQSLFLCKEDEATREILSDSEAAPKKIADFKAAKPSTPIDAKTMTKAEWKQTYYSRFPLGSAVTVVKFKTVFGEPFRTQTVGHEAYWYYECSDGTIQVILPDPNVWPWTFITSLNDY